MEITNCIYLLTLLIFIPLKIKIIKLYYRFKILYAISAKVKFKTSEITANSVASE